MEKFEYPKRETLEEYGIPRRNRGKPARDYGYQNKEILEELYVKKRMPSTKIAEMFGVDDFTVLRWLKRHGIPRRNRTEYGKIKYPKKPFSGDLIERLYLIGLRYGDLHARREGKQVRVSTTSGHPALLELFCEIFSNYTPKINFYPTNDKRGNFGWSVSCLLHPSFDFLLNKDSTIPSYILEDERCFLSFLAGFFDSEGSIIICRTEPRLVGYRLRMPNTNFGVLIKMKEKLSELGFSPKLYLAYKSGRCWKVEINRKSDVFKLLSMLPLRHSEKIMRRDLAFHLRDVKSWDEAKPKVSALRTIIENEVKRCKHEAEMVYRAKLYEKVKP